MKMRTVSARERRLRLQAEMQAMTEISQLAPSSPTAKKEEEAGGPPPSER